MCLGTRPIELRHKHGEESIPTTAGIVSIFQCHQGESSSYLLVLVTDGSSTFQGRIDAKKATKIRPEHQDQNETNQELSDHSKITILSSFILKDTSEHITVSYSYELGEEGTTGIKLVIKEMLSTGVVKVLWADTLKQKDESSGALPFCSILGNCVNEAKDEIDALKTERDSIQADLEGWKDTAEKLDRDWQNEKDALTHRFFELYQKTHEELVKSSQEIKHLKRQVAEARSSGRPTTKAPIVPPADFGQPDDVDFEQFDPDMVENLAAGKRTHVSFCKESANANKFFSVATSGAMRTNSLTGAKEVYNLEDALLQDPEYLGFSQGNISAQAPTKRALPEGSSESSSEAKRLKHISL